MFFPLKYTSWWVWQMRDVYIHRKHHPTKINIQNILVTSKIFPCFFPVCPFLSLSLGNDGSAFFCCYFSHFSLHCYVLLTFLNYFWRCPYFAMQDLLYYAWTLLSQFLNQWLIKATLIPFIEEQYLDIKIQDKI